VTEEPVRDRGADEARQQKDDEESARRDGEPVSAQFFRESFQSSSECVDPGGERRPSLTNNLGSH